METNNSQEFADYFNECLIIDQSKHLWEENAAEEDSAKYAPDADFEAQWLREIGFDSLVSNIEDGKDVDDENLGVLLTTLTQHQTAVVKKKISTFKTTVRKKKQAKSRFRDVREVFPQNSESSSGGTRSCCATPDSLDSISPSRTPPSPREWGPSGIAASPTPSQGYHSHTRSSPEIFGLSDHDGEPRIHSSHSSLQVSNRNEVVSDHSEKEPGFLRIFQTPAYGIDSQPSSDDSSSNEQYQNVRQYRHKSVTYDVPPIRPQRNGYSFSSGAFSSNSAVEIIEYHNTGSMCLHHERFYSPFVEGLSEHDVMLEWQDDSVSNRNNRKDVDWTFERKADVDETSDLPEFYSIHPKQGITHIEDLGTEDIKKLRTLALIELAVVFDSYDIRYSRRKPVKKKRKDNENVFGVSLSALLELDRRINPDTKIPLILKKILNHLEKSGLREEGILRVPGVMAKIQCLKQEIENHFYSSPGLVDQALKASSTNDVAALVKQFLRELPIPLLTNDYMDAFFQIDGITDKSDQIKALKLLTILLPDVHRETLRALFEFLAKVVQNETQNRMSLQNVAMIIAPNLFLPKKLKKIDRDLSTEINTAATTCKITKLMIKYQDILWIVPNFLIQQIRSQNEEALYRRRNSKDVNGKHVKKLLGKTKKTEIYRRINNEVDYQDGIIRLQAHQFGIQNMPIKLESQTTAKDVVFKFVEEFKKSFERNNGNKVQRDLWRRAVTELSPDGNLSCLVSIADPETAVHGHMLYEVGGNIGERCLDSDANMFAVYQRNPNAEWELRCKHWTNQPVVKEVMIM